MLTFSIGLSVVGYGRKTQEGGDTLGGRSATELSANIIKLNQALTGDADICLCVSSRLYLCWRLFFYRIRQQPHNDF
jgi:hypothetical protein